MNRKIGDWIERAEVRPLIWLPEGRRSGRSRLPPVRPAATSTRTLERARCVAPLRSRVPSTLRSNRYCFSISILVVVLYSARRASKRFAKCANSRVSRLVVNVLKKKKGLSNIRIYRGRWRPFRITLYSLQYDLTNRRRQTPIQM